MKIFLILSIVVALCLCGCQWSGHSDPVPKETINPPSSSEMNPQVDPDGQLLCVVKTREDAENVAELYGIQLVRYEGRVAVYHTDEDPGEVIRRGEKNGWTLLSLNYLAELY